jgi:hypothetical protein
MLSLERKQEIRLLYTDIINNIFHTDIINSDFPKYKEEFYKTYERVIVSIIHNNKDLNFNCQDREILYTLKECLGQHWEFRENNLVKSLQCNFDFISPTPEFKNIFKIYKKFYIQRMDLIFEQYDKRFINSNIEDIQKNKEYKSEYLKIKNDIFNLKNQIDERVLKLLIDKISYINSDISELIFNFSKESFKPYFKIRRELEELRCKIKKI